MKRRKLLAVLSVVLCLGVASACGNNTIIVEPDYATEETAAEATATDTAEASTDRAVEDATEEVTQEATEESTEESKAEGTKASDTEEVKEDSEDKKSEEESSEEKKEDSESGRDASGTEDSTEAEETSVEEEIEKLDKAVTMYVQNPSNVRKGPSTIYDKVGSVDINDEVTVTGENKKTGWKQITFNGETAYIHGSRIGTEKVDLEARKAAEEAAAQAALEAQQQAQNQAASTQPATQAQQAAQPAQSTPKAKSTSGGILFIGDSRTCQMRDSTGGAGCGWVCQYGADFGWFNDTGVPTADPMIGAGTKVVICMGVNDPGSLYSYARLTNEKAAEWVARGAKVYYVSLNPVDHPYEDKIIPIDSFNATMPGMLANVYWIDTYNVVKQGGYVLEDGIHYDAAGNINIFNMIIGCVK